MDILRGDLHELGPYGDHRSWELNEPLGFVVGTEVDDLYVIGLKSGVYFFDTVTGAATFVLTHGRANQARINDAGVDALGRVWLGLMTDPPSSTTGAVASIDRGDIHLHVEGIEIPNGFGWSPRGDWLYIVDSATGVVWAHEFDLERGEMGRAHELARIDQSEGSPDGLAVDCNGGIWVAIWGAGVVRCYSPSGVVSDVLELPVPNPTSCAFGGVDLQRMFVTTARYGMTPEALAVADCSGSVFAFDLPVAGVPVPPAAMRGVAFSSTRGRLGPAELRDCRRSG